MFAASLLAQSCEFNRTLPGYDSEYEGDRLVVNGFISQREGAFLHVQKSMDPLGPRGQAEELRAIVELFANGVKMAELPLDPAGLYVAPGSLFADASASYAFEIRAEGLPYASAGPLRLPSRKAEFSAASLVERDGMAEVFVQFEDLPGEANFYQLGFKTYLDGSAVAQEDLHGGDYLGFNFLKDVEHPSGTIGGSHSVRLSGFDGQEHVLDSVQVRLFTLSPELADYLETVDRNELNQADPFAVPVPVLSNIEGGFGFIGSYGLSTTTLEP